VKHFYNARNAILYIQDIEIINAFRDGVSDIKTIEEIKKPKMVADLLAVADVCIEASEARAQLLESRGNGTSQKKDDREVNTADHGDHRDRGDHRFCSKQSSKQKEKGLFGVSMMSRSGVRFTALLGTIWRSAKLSWIRRRCHPHQG
jgi:hypothetical protein